MSKLYNIRKNKWLNELVSTVFILFYFVSPNSPRKLAKPVSRFRKPRVTLTR